MSDILDGLDGLDDLEGLEEFKLDIDESDGSGAIEGVVVDDFDAALADASTMSQQEAIELTQAIKTAATAVYILLERAREGKAYRVLGYDTWESYVRTEFDISKQRSYQIFDWGRAVKMIENVAPEGTQIRLTEPEVRTLKRELPKITEQIERETAGMEPEAAGDRIEEIIQEAKEQKKADDKVTSAREAELEAARDEARKAALEDAADAFLEENGSAPDGSPLPVDNEPNQFTDGADDSFVNTTVAGDSTGPEAAMNLYNFVSAVEGLSGLPEPDEFIDSIPDSRFGQVFESVSEVATWMNRLLVLMEVRKNDV